MFPENVGASHEVASTGAYNAYYRQLASNINAGTPGIGEIQGGGKEEMREG